jgi:peptidoglycan/LPS O-acetylase OafA/YrhL
MLIVLFRHAIVDHLAPATTRVDAAVHAIGFAGWTGIDLFFVLSGFLITGILLDTKGHPRWWSNFIARRALRVFPLYYGALAILFVLLPRLVHWSEPAFITLQANQRWYWTYTVNLLTALTHGRGTPLNTTHFWSLSIEEQFYLIWPLVVWACTPRTLLRVVVLTVMGGFAFRLGLVLQDPANARLCYFLTPGRLDGLMAGAALAVAARTPGGLTRLKALAPKAFGAGLIALASLAMLRGGLDYHEPVAAVAALPVVALVYGALLTMALTGPPSSRLVRMLSNVSLGKWGKYSYGIYVVHFPLLGAIEWKTTFLRHGVALLGGSRLPSVLLFATVGIALSYALGCLSYHMYEKRFLDLKGYFEYASRARATAPVGIGTSATLSGRPAQ